MKTAIMMLFVFVQDSADLVEAAKFAFLIGSIFQFVLAIALIVGAFYLCFRRAKKSEDKKKLWVVTGCIMLVVGVFLLIGSAVAFANYIATLEIIEEMGGSLLV